MFLIIMQVFLQSFHHFLQHKIGQIPVRYLDSNFLSFYPTVSQVLANELSHLFIRIDFNVSQSALQSCQTFCVFMIEFHGQDSSEHDRLGCIFYQVQSLILSQVKVKVVAGVSYPIDSHKVQVVLM